VSTPPRMRPRAAPAVTIAAHMPKAVPLSRSSLNVVINSAKTAGAVRAANPPCRARAATSTPRSGAAPPSAEATAKPMTPVISARRAPKRSLSRPPRRSRPPNPRVYAVDDLMYDEIFDLLQAMDAEPALRVCHLREREPGLLSRAVRRRNAEPFRHISLARGRGPTCSWQRPQHRGGSWKSARRRE
jgi:hypothetical protein